MKKYFLFVDDGGERHVDFVEELEANNYEEAIESAKEVFKTHDLFCDMIGNWEDEDGELGMKILLVTEELPLDLNSWFVSERKKEEKTYEDSKRKAELEQLARLQKNIKMANRCTKCGHSFDISIKSCTIHSDTPAIKGYNVFDKKDQRLNAVRMPLWYPPNYHTTVQNAIQELQEQVDAMFMKDLIYSYGQ